MSGEAPPPPSPEKGPDSIERGNVVKLRSNLTAEELRMLKEEIDVEPDVNYEVAYLRGPRRNTALLVPVTDRSPLPHGDMESIRRILNVSFLELVSKS